MITIPHTTNHCPVAPDTLVLIDLGDGQQRLERAGSCDWGPGLGPDGEGRIYHYVVLVEVEVAAGL